MTTPPVKVVLIDDHMLARHGMAAALTSHGIFLAGVGQDHASGAAAAHAHVHEQGTVLVVDMRLGSESGLELISTFPVSQQKRSIIVTAHPHPSEAVTCLRQNIGGYLSKHGLPADIASAIRTVASGGVVVEPAFSSQVWAELLGSSDRPTLTAREVDLVALLKVGVSSNKDLAERLFVTTTTVRSHFESLYTKFDVNDRAGLVAALWREGFFDTAVP
jgi:DNA-binding NarL/FixJ family response regulator